METKLTIKTNADNFQAFENETQVGQLDFEIDGRTMAIPHTVVFDGNEGKGIGKALVKAAVAYAEAHQLTVNPVCSFAKAIIDRQNGKEVPPPSCGLRRK